jgi:cytochrome c
MASLRSPAVLMTAALLAAGAVGTVASLAVQRIETKHAAETVAAELTGGGNAAAGKAAMDSHGCSACHEIKLAPNKIGQVGPALDGVAGRAFLAGRQPNDPQHLMAWIQHPQAMEPGVGMPETGLSDQETRDLAAYLYTLR